MLAITRVSRKNRRALFLVKDGPRVDDAKLQKAEQQSGISRVPAAWVIFI